MNLQIDCDYVNVSTSLYTSKATVSLENVYEHFINQLDEDFILNNYDNQALFDKLIEKDEDLLHDYLQKSGYVYNKN